MQVLVERETLIVAKRRDFDLRDCDGSCHEKNLSMILETLELLQSSTTKVSLKNIFGKSERRIEFLSRSCDGLKSSECEYFLSSLNFYSRENEFDELRSSNSGILARCS